MRRSTAVLPVLCATSLALAACGGQPQDKDEKAGSYPVSVNADFPTTQRLAQQTQMQIRVKNTGSKTIPDVAVTISDEKHNAAFADTSTQTGLADSSRPLWIVDQGPVGGDTAYVGTWALGALAAGQERTFRWKVTATTSGDHSVTWRVAAGLNGKAVAKGDDGTVPQGRFDVDVSDKPGTASVDPDTGQVVEQP